MEKGKLHDLLTDKMPFSVKQSDYYNAGKARHLAIRRLMQGIFERRENIFVMKKKGKLHDLVTDKMLSFSKKSDYFLP